jgi:hypothetical protein
MSNLNGELVSATFAQLAGSGDIAGIEYYRDSLIGNNALSYNEVGAVNIVASTSMALATQCLALNTRCGVAAMGRAYMEANGDGF